MNWADGFRLLFDGGRFSGWTLDGRAEGAWWIEVSRTALGTEFIMGGW